MCELRSAASTQLGFPLTRTCPFGDGALGRGSRRRAEARARARSSARRLPTGAHDRDRARVERPRADRDGLQAKGVDVDAELMGGDGTVPLLFFFGDQDANHLMVVEAQ